MAAQGGRKDRVHAGWLPPEQRLHLAAVLILLALAAPLAAQNEIDFDRAITQQEFSEFSRLLAQGIYATPVEPARGGSILGFSIGVAATAVPIDTNASYWQRAVGEDFSVSNYVGVPRLVVSKGLGAWTVSGSYAQVPDTDARMIGGALDVPIIDGGLIRPTLALRGVYSRLDGFDAYDLKAYGVELFLSKGIGPVTPYAAAGRMRSSAEGVIPASGPLPEIRLEDSGDVNRFTVGVRLSLFLPKLVIEATQGEERSYAAKVAFGL